MKRKLIAAAAAAASALGISLPAQAADNPWDALREGPHTLFYIKLPLDGRSPKEQTAVWGFSMRGTKDYQVISMDSQRLNSFVQMGFIESKFLVVGVVAAAGAMAVASSGSGAAAQQQQQQQAAAAAAAAATTVAPRTGTSGTTGGTSGGSTGTTPCPTKPSC